MSKKPPTQPILNNYKSLDCANFILKDFERIKNDSRNNDERSAEKMHSSQNKNFRINLIPLE